MIELRHMVQGGFLVCLSAIFQLVPAIYGEGFVFITTISAVPIFILAKINPKTGIIGFAIAVVLVLSISIHEGLFFIFTNGSIGLSLGILDYHTKNKILISIISGLILTFMLSVMNYIIGIPVFGIQLPGSLIVQISIIIIFSIVYCYIYLYLSISIFNYLKRRYPFT